MYFNTLRVVREGKVSVLFPWIGCVGRTFLLSEALVCGLVWLCAGGVAPVDLLAR